MGFLTSTWWGILLLVLAIIFLVLPIIAVFIMIICAVLTSLIVIPLLYITKAVIKHKLKDDEI